MKPVSTAFILLCWMIIFSSCFRQRVVYVFPEDTPDTSAPTEQVPPEKQTALFPEEIDKRTGELLARVGTRRITRDFFDERYKDYLSLPKPESEKILTPADYLQNLIIEELLWNYAKQERVDEDPMFRAALQKAQHKILLDYIMNNKLQDKISVSDEEIAWYYNERMEDFVRPARFQVRHIMTATIEDAREALRRLEAGGEFQEVARNFSIHASRDLGGQLPSFSRGTYNKDFEDAAFVLKVGEKSDIIKTELGYHIIEKTGETPSSAIPFQDVKDQIRRRLTEEKRQRALDHFYQTLFNEASVEILSAP